jgi:glycosyltransferase involved in cell wall biosynthesis
MTTATMKKSGDKIKLLYHSDSSVVKTGFGRHAKALLSYLYNTGKYDIVQVCCSSIMGDPALQSTPWKSIGAVTSDQEKLAKINKNPEKARMAGYGKSTLDDIISQERPDVYFGVQDIWGIDFSVQKEWFRKIPSVLWTTLDSLPILPTALKASKSSKNFWVWSNFAEKEMKRLGHDHVSTVHGCFDTKQFFKIEPEHRQKIRQTFHIEEEAFVIGFVFRNQLRKSVPNLIEGYSKFRKRVNGKKPTYLLLHTHFSEGWNIPELTKEYGIDPKEILTTYVCGNCGNFVINPFSGQNKDCPYCKAEKKLVTTNVGQGVSEDALNLVYNVMDVYCHPFTSGGQEMPIQEAKLTELITLVTEYSCGEEMCEPEAASLPLGWFEYREHGTQFKKASTDPNSIEQQLVKVFNMTPEERAEMGKKARQWVVDNFSIESIGGKVEEFLDKQAKTDYSFDFKRERNANPHALVPIAETDSEWLSNLYKYILDREVDPSYEGHQYWMSQLNNKVPKKDVENYFRKTAIETLQENAKNKKLSFEDLLDKDDEGQRIAFVLPRGAQEIFLSTSVISSIKKIYPDYNIYYVCDPKYFDILDGNSNIHKTIPYIADMNPRSLEGFLHHKGFFEIAFFPGDSILEKMNYTHNDKDIIDLPLCT